MDEQELRKQLTQWQVEPLPEALKEAQRERALMAFKANSKLDTTEGAAESALRTFLWGALGMGVAMLLLMIVPREQFTHAGAGASGAQGVPSLSAQLHDLEVGQSAPVESALISEGSAEVRFADPEHAKQLERRQFNVMRASQRVQLLISLDRPLVLSFVPERPTVIFSKRQGAELVMKFAGGEIALKNGHGVFEGWELSEVGAAQ